MLNSHLRLAMRPVLPALALAILAHHAAGQAPRYSVTPIGTLTGFQHSGAEVLGGATINNFGQVVATAYRQSDGDCDTAPTYKWVAFRYTPGQPLLVIGEALNEEITLGLGINDSGQVFGYSQSEPFVAASDCEWNSQYISRRAWRYSDSNGLEFLSIPASTMDRFSVMGYTNQFNASGVVLVSTSSPREPGRYMPTGYQTLAMLDAELPNGPTLAAGINDLNDVVGTVLGSYAFRWSDSSGLLKVFRPDTPGGGSIAGRAINNRGDIAGDYSLLVGSTYFQHAWIKFDNQPFLDIHDDTVAPGSSVQRVVGDFVAGICLQSLSTQDGKVFRWSPQSGMDAFVANARSGNFCGVTAMNRFGVVLGYDGFVEPWVWTPSAGLVYLYDAIDPVLLNRYTFRLPVAMNDRGQIVLQAVDSMLGQSTLVILTPICRGDIDANGQNINDIFLFLNLWFANDPIADFDFSGTVAIDDIFVFLNVWFAGC